MHSFLARFSSEIKGTLSGFDRVRFRGTIRWLASLRGMSTYLATMGLLLKDFTAWGKDKTNQIQKATERLAENTGRPLIYLPSSSEGKESRALEIAQADGITQGLVAVFKCVEPCHTFKVGPNAASKMLELRQLQAKCSHLYFYLLDPQLGLTHLRLQTWAPFTTHVCINGREWLSRQLTREGLGFEQRDNCFVHVDNVRRAQALLSRQLRTNWSRLLDRFVASFHPAHRTMFSEYPLEYYWSAEETEWATDVMFRSPEALTRIYPKLLHHGITTFGSRDVLRFLGQPPIIRIRSHREIVSTVRKRPEGTRLKHVSNRNSIKMYDKQESVLRVETTINNPRDMKVYRTREGDPRGPQSWQCLRKGVADLHRRAELSQKSNERYLDALAAVEHDQPLADTLRTLCQPTEYRGRRVRALQPLGECDGVLLATVIRGDFAILGFRNRDLRPLLFGTDAPTPEEAKRQASKITRLLRMLRAHGIIQKVPKTHRYTVTQAGRQAIVALQTAKQASTSKLLSIAA
jgi:hypothetical protein